MISAQKLPSYISPEDYLPLEERASTKHECLDGVIYDWQGGVTQAMAGGTVEHAKVILDGAIALRNQLRGSPCTVVSGDVRLHDSDRNAYLHPDVMVSCSPGDKARNDGFSEPSQVVEVLSPSTELSVRGEQSRVYRSLARLRSNVLISPDRRTIEVFDRGCQWAPQGRQETTRLDGSERVRVGALDLSLLAADMFEGL